jgi:hypothetical protein
MMGEKGKLLLLNCQPHSVEGLIDLPAGIQLVGILSNVKHRTYEEAYRDTRVAAFMAQAMIVKAYNDFGVKGDPTKGYLANVKPEMYRQYFRRFLPRNMTGKYFREHFGKTIDWITTVEEAKHYHVRAAADYHVLEGEAWVFWSEDYRGGKRRDGGGDVPGDGGGAGQTGGNLRCVSEEDRD